MTCSMETINIQTSPHSPPIINNLLVYYWMEAIERSGKHVYNGVELLYYSKRAGRQQTASSIILVEITENRSVLISYET